MPVVQVIIDASTNKLIAGVYTFDRDNGGTFIGGSGTSFPGTPAAKEWFWRSDENKLYRRNDANDAWDTVTAAVSSHAIGGSDHTASTLSELNGKVSDATLIDTADSRLSDARAPTAHDLGGSAHNADTLANLNLKVSDATLIDTADSRLSDARTPTAHDLGGSEHGADTLANLNLKVSDATLIDTADSRLSDARDPTSHASSHQNGGGDEVATATPTANSIPKTAGATTLDAGWVADGADATAIHDDTAGEIGAVTEKGAPVSADLLLIEDSEAAGAKKRVQAGNLPVATHASTHQNGGADEVATATPTANSIPKTAGATTLDAGWVPDGADATAIHDNATAEISALDSKATPVSDDVLLLEDSAASYGKKKLLISNLPGGVDTTAIHKAVDAEISAMTSKAAPVSADVFVIEDSEASYAKKKVLVSNLPGGTDTTAIHKATAAEISAMTEKTTPVSGDHLVIEDSAASNAKKRVQVGNLPGAPPSTTTATATASTTTTNTSYEAMSGMTITPAAGTYMVWFSSSINHGTNGGTIDVAIYSGGTIDQQSARHFGNYRNGQTTGIATQCHVTVNGSQAIAIYWRTPSGGTATAYERSLCIMKVAA